MRRTRTGSKPVWLNRTGPKMTRGMAAALANVPDPGALAEVFRQQSLDTSDEPLSWLLLAIAGELAQVGAR